MPDITFRQLLAQAALQGADVTRRGDGVPVFMIEQTDAQPAKDFLITRMADETEVKYGDVNCALLMGSLNLSGAETEAFFTQAAEL